MGRIKSAYTLGKKITVKLPEAAVEKLDALTLQLNKDSKFRIEGPWDRSKAIRWAVVRAMKAFEHELLKKLGCGGIAARADDECREQSIRIAVINRSRALSTQYADHA